MIRHTVASKLKHPAGSDGEQEFLEAARRLEAIPTVQNFEALRQTGQKNQFDFGLSLEFSSAADWRLRPAGVESPKGRKGDEMPLRIETAGKCDFL